jgi:hypothetical protein
MIKLSSFCVEKGRFQCHEQHPSKHLKEIGVCLNENLKAKDETLNVQSPKCK